MVLHHCGPRHRSTLPAEPPICLRRQAVGAAQQDAAADCSVPERVPSEQGAGDFAEAAVEAIAQRLDMGGAASPTTAEMSQDEVAYTPSAMDADDPHSHSKVHSCGVKMKNNN